MSTAPSGGRLLQLLGVGFGVAVTIGTTIGAGIFRAPGEVAAQLPTTPLFLAAWAVGGVYALLGAIQRLYPDRIGWSPRHFDRLAGGPDLREAIEAGRSVREIVDSWQEPLDAFRQRVGSLRLYP